jgi:hypothetical protein
MAATINGVSAESFDWLYSPGLDGTDDSLGYRVGEIERHLHAYERWMELAGTPAAETHRADPAGTGAGIFQIDAGNDDWGAWLQILGSSDTPIISGSVKFDLHRLLVTATERNATYVVQIAFGATGAAALAAGAYIETVFSPSSNLVDSGPVNVQSRRIAVGTKGWARCICPGQDTATLSFMIGLHEYEG